MLWPQNNNALALRKQSLVRQDKITSFYSIEDLRQKLPISTYVNPYATRLVRSLDFWRENSNLAHLSFTGGVVQGW